MTRDPDDQSPDSEQNSGEKLVNDFTAELESILADYSPSEWSYEPRTDLSDLGVDEVNTGSTDKLEFVLKKLDESDELAPGLCWSTEVWDDVTIEELIGALLVANYVLGLYREQAHGEYKPAADFIAEGDPE